MSEIQNQQPYMQQMMRPQQNIYQPLQPVMETKQPANNPNMYSFEQIVKEKDETIS